MASQIRVTSSKIKSKIEELRKLNSNFQKRLEDMRQTKDEVLKMWEGDASKEFQKKFQKDYDKISKMYSAVESYCKALEAIVNEYDTTEKKNISIVSK